MVIIEIIWGIMPRRVYARHRRFKEVEEHEIAVREVWAELSTDYLYKLYYSIPKRLMAVTDKKGNPKKK